MAAATGLFLATRSGEVKPVERQEPTNFLPIPQSASVTTSKFVRSASPPPPAIPSVVESKSNYVDRLAKSNSPSDAFAAYQTIANCTRTRMAQESVADRAADGQPPDKETVYSACGDLSSSQISERLQLLRRATQAGIHGAAGAFLDEGPGGYGSEIQRSPDDPELLAYVKESQEAIAIGATYGDWWSLLSTSGNYQLTGDLAVAMQYLVAANDSYQAEHGSDFRHYKNRLEALAKKIPADQIEPAMEAGHQIFLNSKR